MRKSICALLFCLSLAAAAEPIKFPVRRLLKEVGMTVDVYLTEVNANPKTRRAWCYRTVGHKPNDFVAILLVDEGDKPEKFPEEPFKLLGGLKSSKAKALEFSDFGGPAFLQPEFVGALFIDSVGLKGVPKASACLALVPITKNEIAVADMAGPSRLVGGLANQARYYPCPVWIDRKRKSAFSDADLRVMKEDLLLKIPSFWSQASVRVVEGRCTLSVYPAEAINLAERLEKARKSGLRVALTVDKRADAFLVWTSDHKPSAVTPPGSHGRRMSGQYLCVVPGQKSEECRLLDDGYTMLTSDAFYNQLIQALKKGQARTWKLAGSPINSFALESKLSDYQNPTERVTMRADWVTYEPDRRRKSSGPVDMKEIVLLTDETEISAAVSVGKLADYTKNLESVCLVKLKQLHPKAATEAAVLCDLAPKRAPRYRIALKNDVTGANAVIQSLYQALAKVKAPAVTGPVRFNLHFTIKPH
ncbi:DUF3480 domain-containing protein [bacterium]|nr:DUF3480 domain-containing protein [bacterium]